MPCYIQTDKHHSNRNLTDMLITNYYISAKKVSKRLFYEEINENKCLYFRSYTFNALPCQAADIQT